MDIRPNLVTFPAGLYLHCQLFECTKNLILELRFEINSWARAMTISRFL